jgi:hypothetical protein
MIDWITRRRGGGDRGCDFRDHGRLVEPRPAPMRGSDNVGRAQPGSRWRAGQHSSCITWDELATMSPDEIRAQVAPAGRFHAVAACQAADGRTGVPNENNRRDSAATTYSASTPAGASQAGVFAAQGTSPTCSAT